MIDFAKIRADRTAVMSPEERARADALAAREAAAEATACDIEAVFERLAVSPPSRCVVGRVVEQAWTQAVRLRIESLGSGDVGREVLRFIGAVTGHEAYALDEDFIQSVEEAAGKAPGRFYICAGTPGRYEACSVEASAIAAYLLDQRPGLFEARKAPAF